MKRVIAALIVSAVVSALFVMGPLGALPKGARDTFNKSHEHEAPDCNGIELSIWSPDALWPPNHKYYEDIYVEATDPENGTVTLTTVGTHDQYDADTGVEQNGSGNTGDDFTVDDEDSEWVENDPATQSSDPQITAIEEGDGSVRTDWAARAERSGRDQTGRSYTLEATAADDNGGSCEFEWSFVVPHDMRQSNRDFSHDEEA